MDKEKMTDKLISPLICDYCKEECFEWRYLMYSSTGYYDQWLKALDSYKQRRKKCLEEDVEACASVYDADEVEVNDLDVTMQAEEE